MKKYINISSRACQILRKIIRTEQAIVMAELASIFAVSVRTIRYDLDSIDDFLVSNSFPKLIRKSSEGLRFPNDDSLRENVERLLTESAEDSQWMAPGERLIEILCALLQGEAASLEKISKKQDVSKTTIVNDFYILKKAFGVMGVKIEAKHGSFLRLQGDEQAIRDVSASLISEQLNVHHLKMLLLTEGVHMPRPLKTLFGQFTPHFVRRCVHLAVTAMDDLSGDSIYLYYVVGLCVILQRVFSGTSLAFLRKDEIPDFKAVQAAEQAASLIFKEYGVLLDEQDIRSTALLFSKHMPWKMACNLYENPVIMPMTASNLVECVCHDLGLMPSQALFYNVEQELKLIFIKNQAQPLTEAIGQRIEKQYPQLVFTLQKYNEDLRIRLGKALNKEQILHLSACFIETYQNLKKKTVTRMRVVFVCNAGFITSKLLAHKLSTFLDIEIIASVSLYELNNLLSKERIDAIIATINIDIPDIPCIVISPLLDDGDIASLRAAFPIKRLSWEIVEKLAAYVRRTDPRDLDVLKNEIANLLGVLPLLPPHESDGLSLLQLMPPDFVIPFLSVASWEEAIRMVAKPLLQAKLILAEYLEETLRQMTDEQTFVLVGKGVILAHAGAARHVIAPCVSYLRLREAILFPSADGNKADIVFMIATPNRKIHLKAIDQLAKLVSNERLMSMLRLSYTKEDVLHVIREISVRTDDIHD